MIGLITAALATVISYSLRKDLLDREWRITADYVQTEAFYHLAPSDFAAPWSAPVRQRFEEFYRQTVTMPEIVRVKIYDDTMTVIWSDEPRLVGQRFPDNPHLEGAIGGRVMIHLGGKERKGENLYERSNLAELVEVYVPIRFPGTERVAGVVETYKLPTRVFANIRKGWMTVILTALIGGVFLYFSLFWIVRRAARRIAEQHDTLAATNQELRAVQAQLLEAERMAAIGEVVTAVAHGIRNPLANIRASAQVASLESKASASPPTYPMEIMQEVDRLEGRLKELLQFVGPADRRSVSLDLNEVLRETLRLMAGRLAKSHLRVQEQLAPSLPPVLGNGMLIEQIFLSLIGNAIEAIPDRGGTITLTTGTAHVAGGSLQVFVEVRDTGVGIPDEERPKLFRSFYTTKAQGTGLGLAIARKFTEAHGGAIVVSSRPGEGSTFRVTLPAHAGS